MLSDIQIKIERNLIKDALPKYATAYSAGLDLKAAIEEKIILAPNQVVLIPTGISIHIADNNYCGLIFPRSGLGYKHGIILANGTGVIDADYQGEIFVPLWNRGTVAYEISSLERIAQLIFSPIVKPNFSLVEEFTQQTKRGEGGFGSTGK